MGKTVMEVIHGKHRIFEVARASTLFGLEYQVRSTDGKLRSAFKRLDEAVNWARAQAREH